MQEREKIVVNTNLNPNLEKRSRYCKSCKDNYWNKGDCGSIRETSFCIACFKKEEQK